MSHPRLRPFQLALLSLLVAACSSSGEGGGGAGSGGSPTGGTSSGGTSSGGTSSGGSSSGGASSGVPEQHRATASTCSPSTTTASPCGGIGSGECSKDSDCASGTNGHCTFQGGGAAICHCFYDTCANDSECTSGGPCACQGSPYQSIVNACVQGNCKVDADCGASGYCSPSAGTSCSGGLAGYFCHTPSDECLNDSDCADAGPAPVCAYDSTKKHWACAGVQLCP